MYVLAVAGPDDAGRAELVDRVVETLAADGSVAVASVPDESVEPDSPGTRYRERGARTAVSVGPDGWVAAGTERTLGDVLDDLAPGHDYCVLDGVGDATVPGVVLGGVEYAGETLSSAAHQADVDVEAVVEALRNSEPHETLESLVERATASPDADRAGAVATFTGRVRARDHADDERTTHLEFETYEGVAEERMRAIETELAEREGVYEVVMHHRTGVVAAGGDIVFVVVLAGHRPEAFETVSDGIDRLKDEVPIFKKEATTGGEFWVHERDSDAH